MSPEDENFICTTSRNRVLFKSKQAELLNQLFTDICVPMAVVTEIMSAENSDLAKQNLPEKIGSGPSIKVLLLLSKAGI